MLYRPWKFLIGIAGRVAAAEPHKEPAIDSTFWSVVWGV